MITSPPPVYVSTKAAGLIPSSIWSYGTINLRTRFIKRVGKGVQGLNPTVATITGNIVSGAEIFGFPAKTKHYVVLPQFSDDGQTVTAKSAKEMYNSTGLHLGVFRDAKSAEKYGKALDKAYKAWAAIEIKTTFALDKLLIDATFQYDDNQALSWYTGNINLFNRPVVQNKDKSISTLLSITIFSDGKYVLIPRVVVRNGVPAIVSADEAEKEYAATGQHLGKFASVKEAEIAAKRLSKQQNTYYSKFYTPPSGSTEYALSRAWKPVEMLLRENPDAKPPFAGIVKLSDISDNIAQDYFQENIVNIGVQYNMDLTSSITVTVSDPGYKMMENNYFIPRRLVEYRGRQYEIADVACREGSSGSPEINLTLCSRAIQQMKRDKKRGSVKGNSGYEYARNVAAKYNLGFVGQKTAKTKSQFNARSGEQEESVWDVLTRTAGNNQFVCFVVDDILIYAQHEYLLWRFGLVEALVKSSGKSVIRKYTPLLYLPGNDGPVSDIELQANFLAEENDIRYARHSIDRFGFRLETYPQFETSDNDPLAATGSCRVLMPNGGQLRPGQTVMVGPRPSYFFGAYLITAVSFTEGSPESAQVTFRTPVEPLKQNGKPIKSFAATSPVSTSQRNLVLS